MGSMDLVRDILVILHIVGFGVVLGGTLAQLPNVKKGTAQISKGILHGSLLLLVTGLALVGMMYARDLAPDNAKIGAKTLVLLAIIVLVILNRKKERVSGGVLGAIAGLSAVNVALAIIW